MLGDLEVTSVTIILGPIIESQGGVSVYERNWLVPVLMLLSIVCQVFIELCHQHNVCVPHICHTIAQFTFFERCCS